MKLDDSIRSGIGADLNLPRQNPPTLFLICGYIGSGKTTYSIDLANRENALRLTLDEWVNKLYGADAKFITGFDPQVRVKEVMWQVAEQALKLGISVVLDWGFWKRSERDDFREKSGSIGSSCKVIYLELSKEDCLKRTIERNKELDSLSVKINLDEFEQWWQSFETPVEEDVEKVIT
jgi:predicted kinase